MDAATSSTIRCMACNTISSSRSWFRARDSIPSNSLALVSTIILRPKMTSLLLLVVLVVLSLPVKASRLACTEMMQSLAHRSNCVLMLSVSRSPSFFDEISLPEVEEAKAASMIASLTFRSIIGDASAASHASLGGGRRSNGRTARRKPFRIADDSEDASALLLPLSLLVAPAVARRSRYCDAIRALAPRILSQSSSPSPTIPLSSPIPSAAAE
mmetsp:Transcript_15718/g.34165  ORF Transcript_15718/g.34165 Transcript_15718/m.34165 type:complete len:214 (+) Transcript_15718:5530-6171(+)